MVLFSAWTFPSVLPCHPSCSQTNTGLHYLGGGGGGGRSANFTCSPLFDIYQMCSEVIPWSFGRKAAVKTMWLELSGCYTNIHNVYTCVTPGYAIHNNICVHTWHLDMLYITIYVYTHVTLGYARAVCFFTIFVKREFIHCKLCYFCQLLF